MAIRTMRPAWITILYQRCYDSTASITIQGTLTALMLDMADTWSDTDRQPVTFPIKPSKWTPAGHRQYPLSFNPL